MWRWSTAGLRRLSARGVRQAYTEIPRTPASSSSLTPSKATAECRGTIPTISRSFHQSTTSHLPRKPTPVKKHSQLPPPDDEQKAILQTFSARECNIMIDACAGAGKTTFILLLALHNPQSRFLIFCYNNRLAAETVERAENLGLKNCRISTFHAFGYKYYSRECKTDMGLKRVVQNALPLKTDLETPDFDVLVMDELQDMTPVMKKFVDKLWSDLVSTRAGAGSGRKPPRIVALGDRRQGIYDFNNADPRFLTLANKPELFGSLNDYPWEEMVMSKSNRCPPKMTRVINRLIPSRHPISSAGHAGMKHFPVEYKIISPKNRRPLIEYITMRLSEGYNPGDILLLSPSTRYASDPLKGLLNTLVKPPHKLPIHVPDSDYDVDPRSATGKIVCSTFHQAKGIQRKVVVVFGFDSSYLQYYDRFSDSMEYASNALYVAGTRATERLVFVQSNTEKPLPFVDMQDVAKLHENGDLVYAEHDPPELKKAKKSPKQPSYAVTALLRNVSDECLSKCLALLEVTELDPPKPYAEPPATTQDVYKLLEPVSEITGTAIISIYMNLKGIKPSLLGLSLNPLSRDLPRRYLEKVSAINGTFKVCKKLSLPEILYLANLHCASQSRLIFKVLSIATNRYNWLEAADAESIFQVLDKFITKENENYFESFYEVKLPDISVPGNTSDKPLLLKGAPDVLDATKRNIIEVKYTDTFSPSDAVQVAIYAEMARRERGKEFTAALVSAKTGQRFRVKPKSSNAMRRIIQNLVFYKTEEKIVDGAQKKLKRTTDEEFLEEARNEFPERVLPVTLVESYGMLPEEVEKKSAELRLERGKRKRRKGE